MSAGFRAGCSGAEDLGRAVDETAAALAGPGGPAALGLVYATDSLAASLEPVVERLSEATGVRLWVGTQAAGVLCGRRAFYGRPGLAAMTLDLPTGSWAAFDTVAPELPAAAADGRPPVALVHGDPRNGGLKTILDHLQESSGAFLVGGLTSGRGGRFDQAAGAIVDGGVSGLMLAPGQVAATGLSQAFRPLGPPHRVTRADGNVVRELDGESPVAALRADVELLPEALLRGGQVELSAGLVVSGSDQGDFLVRPMMLIERDGAIALGEEIEEGALLLFCRYDKRGAARDLEEMAARAARRLAGPPRAAVYVACTGRGPHLFPRAEDELDLIADALADCPMIGFYAAGEISGGRIYSYTGVLTVL